jgi:hypothetical protein
MGIQKQCCARATDSKELEAARHKGCAGKEQAEQLYEEDERYEAQGV